MLASPAVASREPGREEGLSGALLGHCPARLSLDGHLRPGPCRKNHCFLWDLLSRDLVPQLFNTLSSHLPEVSAMGSGSASLGGPEFFVSVAGSQAHRKAPCPHKIAPGLCGTPCVQPAETGLPQTQNYRLLPLLPAEGDGHRTRERGGESPEKWGQITPSPKPDCSHLWVHVCP